MYAFIFEAGDEVERFVRKKFPEHTDLERWKPDPVEPYGKKTDPETHEIDVRLPTKSVARFMKTVPAALRKWEDERARIDPWQFLERTETESELRENQRHKVEFERKAIINGIAHLVITLRLPPIVGQSRKRGWPRKRSPAGEI